MPRTDTPRYSRSVSADLALAALAAGALAVVLAAAPFKAFELDRFFVPKELVLHVTALLAAIPLLVRRGALPLDRGDTLLAIFAALSALSALLATNHWLAMRALAITTSGVMVFWSARTVAASGRRRALVGMLGAATVLGAATALAQAYGVTSDYLSTLRAPGGTFGNRNFMAHLAAIGVPLVIWSVTTARRGITVLAGTLGAGVLAAALVLSRSRAAWLALIVAGGVVAIPAWLAARRIGPGPGRRLALLAFACVTGAGLALALPNALDWRSESPYLDSVRGLVNSESGSGHGRIVQYRRSLRMAAAHPVLGVGPGNWPVVYPRFAARGDPSLDRATGMTSNPWPSSDWVALVSERGWGAAVLLALAIVTILVNTWRGAPRTERDPFVPLALTAVVLVTAATGALDAVLLLAAPSLIVWAALGALSVRGRERMSLSSGRWTRRGIAAALAITALFAARSAAAVRAMAVYHDGTRVAAAARAARWDPGSFRIQWRLAQLELARRGCRAASGPARRTAAMFPAAPEPRALLARCGR